MKIDKTTFKIYFKKLLRWIKISKPIELTESEIKLIKLCKLHYREDKRYKYTGHEWTDVLKPMFKELYGWDPDEHYGDYLSCIFGKLFSIYMKIQDDRSGSDRQLFGVFTASFYKGIARDQEKPIERAISELCALIQYNLVLEHGVERYTLDLPVEHA